MVEALIAVLGAGLLGIGGWAINLHSRVAVLEAEKITLKEVMEAQKEALKEFLDMRLLDITRRLDRIEHKLDQKEVD